MVQPEVKAVINSHVCSTQKRKNELNETKALKHFQLTM